ncbi:MAG: hypothetical protein ABI587_15120 [Gemmatimonadales bacterium]
MTTTDSLRLSLQQISARLDSVAAGRCPTGPLVVPPMRGDTPADSLYQLVAGLRDRLDRLVADRCATPAAMAAPADTASDDLAALRAAAADAAGGSVPSASIKADTQATEPTQFISRQRNGSAMNPEISATGDIRLIGSRHGEQVQGDAHEFEVALQSTLDPYSSAKVIMSFSNEEVGIEEGYLYYTGLPGRIRADLGLFRQQIGDLNRWHLHALPESEYPLVYQRYLTPDGLSGAGLSLYTALPLSILHGTHEIWLQGTTAESDPLYGAGRHGTLLGRVQNFWQLSRSTFGQVGFTALGGNADSLRGRVMGVDLRLSWRPPNAGTRRNATLRAEGYRFHGLETGTGTSTTRYGMFADLTVQATRRWVFGTRYDYVESPRGVQVSEWQVSPTITWWQSEFVYLRLEGQHHHQANVRDEDRLLLQAVFAMGPHKHETY